MSGPKSYRSWSPDQPYLMPPSPGDWLPDDHLARFVLELVRELDLSAVERPIQSKDPRGERPYDPRMDQADDARLGAGVPETDLPGELKRREDRPGSERRRQRWRRMHERRGRRSCGSRRSGPARWRPPTTIRPSRSARSGVPSDAMQQPTR